MKFNKDTNNRAIITTEQAIELYLDYVNNYLTVEKFSQDYDLDYDDALNILSRGKLNHA